MLPLGRFDKYQNQGRINDKVTLKFSRVRKVSLFLFMDVLMRRSGAAHSYTRSVPPMGDVWHLATGTWPIPLGILGTCPKESGGDPFPPSPASLRIANTLAAVLDNLLCACRGRLRLRRNTSDTSR